MDDHSQAPGSAELQQTRQRDRSQLALSGRSSSPPRAMSATPLRQFGVELGNIMVGAYDYLDSGYTGFVLG